jgi:hypothetical protein
VLKLLVAAKNTMRKLTFLILLINIFFSCKKEKLTITLPAITTSGSNTFGFLVEEKVWVPKCGAGETCINLASFLPGNKQFELSGEIKIKGKESNFTLYIDSLFSEGTCSSYSVMSLADSKGIVVQNGGYYDNVCGPNTASYITITKLDTTNKIVSGIFQARLKKVLVTNLNFQDLYSNSPEYIEIKEGRFDMHYH